MKKKTDYLGRYGLAFLLAALLFVMMGIFAHATDEGTGETATVKAGKTGINVRATAVDGGVVATVDGGDSFDVLGSTTGSDGNTWYEISGTKGGNTIHGYIRSDMVEISQKEEAPADGGDADTTGEPTSGEVTEESSGDDTPATSTMGSILAMDPPTGEDGSAAEPPVLPAGFTDTRIRVGDREVQAWTNETFYIFYATSPSGNVGWFLYDSAEGRWVRYIDFLIDGGVGSAASADGGKSGGSKVLIVILVILIILLAAACAFLAFKLFSGGRDDDYYDDDDDDDYRPAKRSQAQARQPVKQPATRPASGGAAARSPQARPASAGGSAQHSASSRPATQVRPSGQRSAAGAGSGTGAAAPARRQSSPQGSQAAAHRQSQAGGPVTRRSSGAPAQRSSQPSRQSRPIVDDDEE